MDKKTLILFEELGRTVVEYETRISELERRIDVMGAVIEQVGNQVVEMMDDACTGDQS